MITHLNNICFLSFNYFQQKIQREYYINSIMTDIENNMRDQQQINQMKNRAIIDEEDLDNFDMDVDPFENIQLSEEEIYQKHEKIDIEVEIEPDGVMQNSSKYLNRVDSVQLNEKQDDDLDESNRKSHRLSERTPKKIRIKRKRQKKEKRLKKLKKIKQRKQNESKQKMKKLKKLSAKKNSDGEYSSDNNDSFSSLNGSSDSVLANLNPRKRRKTSPSKKLKTQKKEGFSLKQLGNDGEVSYGNNNEDDQSYSSNKGKKHAKKNLKKKSQVTNNQDLLKKLLEIGLCVEEEEHIAGQQDNSEREYDDGIDAINQLKGSKKKGPKIANRLFSDMLIEENQFQNCEPPPSEIQLQVKPRQQKQLSTKACSFLSRTQKLKKIRGIQSTIACVQNEAYDKIVSEKVKQSIVRIIKQKRLQDAEQIELDVKVPAITRGRSSGEINNSMYFRKLVQKQQMMKNNQSEYIQESPQKTPAKDVNNFSKMSRKQMFQNLLEDVKNRKSKNITHALIAKSFKITQLEEIEDMRKKKEEKRKNDRMGDSDEDEEESKEQIQKVLIIEQNQQLECQKIEQNINLSLEKKVSLQQQPLIVKDADNDASEEYEEKQFKIQIQKQEVPNHSICEDKYRQLIRLEEGQQGQQEVEQYISQQDNQENQIGQQVSNPNHQNEEEHEQHQGQQSERDQQKSESSEKKSSNNPKNENKQKQQELLFKTYRQKNKNFMIESDEELQNHQNNQQHGKDCKDSSSQQKAEDFEPKNFKIEINKELIQEKQNFLSQSINQMKIPKNQDIKISKMQEQSKQSKQNEEQNKMRKQFFKLRRFTTIIKEKKIKQNAFRMTQNMFDLEAEQGSDNQQHDQRVKAINYDEQKQEYQNMDLDADLEEFLDNQIDINDEDEENAFRKYREDVKLQEREELKRIINGDFKRRYGDDHVNEQEVEEDQRKRQQRMDQIYQYMQKRDQDQEKQFYHNPDQNQNNMEIQQNKEIQVVDDMNEQNLKRYLDDNLGDATPFQQTIIKPRKIVPQSYQRDKKLEKRNTMKPISNPNTYYTDDKMKIDNESNIMLNKNRNIGSKLKKSSSHLNQLIMKNKLKSKPNTFSRGMMPFSKK